MPAPLDVCQICHLLLTLDVYMHQYHGWQPSVLGPCLHLLFFHICRIVEHILGAQRYLETDHHRTSHLGCPENEDPPRPQKLAKKTPKSKIFILFTFYANQTYFHKKVLHQEVTRKWPMRMYAYFLKDHSRPQRQRSFWSAPRRHDLWVNTGSPRFNHCVINWTMRYAIFYGNRKQN